MTPSNVVIIPTDTGFGTNHTPLLIPTLKTALSWILASAATLTAVTMKLSGNGDGNLTPATSPDSMPGTFWREAGMDVLCLRVIRWEETSGNHYCACWLQECLIYPPFMRTPFLSLLASPPPASPPQVQKVIKLDKLHWFSHMWVGAHVLVFNSGHWWNPHKTTNSGCFFQEGANVNISMDVSEAFRRSIQTWKSWALNSLDPDKSFIFFRSYSPVHYRGGKWNEGGGCDIETEPDKDTTRIELEPYNNVVISEAVKQMEYGKWKVQFLNITNLSEMRRDGHPSKYREEGTPPGAPQDCSHWCLPGVPDTWNELLYAHLISKQFRINSSY